MRRCAAAGISPCSRRGALLRAGQRFECRAVRGEVGPPRVGSRLATRQAVEAIIPAGRVPRGGASRELVGEDQPGPPGFGA